MVVENRFRFLVENFVRSVTQLPDLFEGASPAAQVLFGWVL
jgi:hypothetical protein